jgi:hypothetical protein
MPVTTLAVLKACFEAEEWLAAMCSHVPNREEQRVRDYGGYSNVMRGES